MICFIAVVLIIGIFCVTVVTRDIVLDERRRKSTTPVVEAKPQAEVAAEPVKESAPLVVAAPVEEPVAEQEKEPEEVAIEIETDTETAAAEEETADEDGRVNFSAGTKTLDEKYLELSPEYKGYYDEIVRYAMAVEGSKRYKNANYEEYKVGKSRLVRLKIKRDTLICELVIPNLDFKNYVSENKVEVKQAPATIKVTDENAPRTPRQARTRRLTKTYRRKKTRRRLNNGYENFNQTPYGKSYAYAQRKRCRSGYVRAFQRQNERHQPPFGRYA